MRRDDLELPARATEHRVAFDPDARPDLTEPNRSAVQGVGRESFDSLALATRWQDPRTEAPTRRRYWKRLPLPVVPDRPQSMHENVQTGRASCRGKTCKSVYHPVGATY